MNPRRWMVVFGFVLAFLAANFAVPISAKVSEPVYSPLNDPRPAQGKVTAPSAPDLAYLQQHLPPSVQKRMAQVQAASKKSAFSLDASPTFLGNANNIQFMPFNNTNTNKGILVLTSVCGGCSLSKPSSSDNVSIYWPELEVSTSCFGAYYQNYSQPGTTATTHVFVIINYCTASIAASYTVNATTWANYTQLGTSIGSITKAVTFSDKYSYIRNYKLATGSWNVDIYNFSTSSYDNMVTYLWSAPAGSSDSHTLFEDQDYNTKPASSCAALGTYNIVETLQHQKWSGSAWSAIATADLVGVTNDPSTCFQFSGGSDNWHWADTGTVAPGGGPGWSVCGPSNTNCR